MNRKQKRNLYRIIAAGLLLAAVWAAPLTGWLRLALFLIPYALVGYDVLWTALRNILHGQVFDENFLMSLATIGAFATGEYPEAVAVMLFYQVGELFQSLAVGKSRRSIAALMDIRPDHANVLRAGKEICLEPEEVAVGETILVKPGEKIPLDGVILQGRTSVNTAALTGESLPREAGVGDNVISGSINVGTLIQVKVSKVYQDSTVARILELVENSAAKKAKAENFITRFARWYTPCVVIGALLLAVLPPLLGAGAWVEWIQRALMFLVVSCPCALVISVPLSFFGGIGGASRQGILIKGASYLETLAKVDTVVFDKTGTLTQGNFSVVAVHPQQMPEAELLDIAALAESYSTHPIAASILQAHGGHIDKSRIGQVEEVAGQGLRAIIDGQSVCAGNDKLMAAVGVEWRDCHQAGTIVHIAIDGVYAGHIVIADQVKPDSAAAIRALKALGVSQTVLLTGDSQRVGQAVGAELGVDSCYCQLLPADKVTKVEEMLAAPGCSRSALAFVGDGINDAPVLSRADVGVAMGALGSDAAIEAADVVLMDDKPTQVAAAMRIARRTMAIVRQNIILSLAVKGAVLLLAALGLVGLWFAVFADVGVCVLAVSNSLRALQTVKK